MLDKQRFDGAFGLWSSRDEAEPWLSAYALEFLTRARARQHAVPDTPYLAGLTWLRHHAIDGGTTPTDLAARAYALHVLALAGQLTPAPARYFHDAFIDQLPTPLARAQLAAALRPAALEGRRCRDACSVGVERDDGVRAVRLLARGQFGASAVTRRWENRGQSGRLGGRTGRHRGRDGQCERAQREHG